MTNFCLTILTVLTTLVQFIEGATTVGWVACMASCMNTCVPFAAGGGPVGAGGCVALCGSVCTCFAQNTSIITDTGLVSIEELKAGDLVLTRDGNGTDMYTNVVDVTYIPAYFNFVTMQLEGEHGSLTVTTNHLMPICNVMDNSITSMKYALDVSTTDGLLLPDGCFRVQSTEKVQQFGKHSLTTEACTVYANSVLTTTSCENHEMIKKFDGFKAFQLAHTPEGFEKFVEEHHRLQNMTI